MTREQLGHLRRQAEHVYLHPDLARYIVDLARQSREDEQIKLGISPRGALHLAQAARAYAFVQGEESVLPDHIQRLVRPVWGHRLLPRHGRDHNRNLAGELLDAYVARVALPR